MKTALSPQLNLAQLDRDLIRWHIFDQTYEQVCRLFCIKYYSPVSHHISIHVEYHWHTYIRSHTQNQVGLDLESTVSNIFLELHQLGKPLAEQLS